MQGLVRVRAAFQSCRKSMLGAEAFGLGLLGAKVSDVALNQQFGVSALGLRDLFFVCGRGPHEKDPSAFLAHDFMDPL